MDLSINNISALVLVSSILLISVGYNLGILNYLERTYDKIINYFKNISLSTLGTALLFIFAVILAIVASF
jgi:hypothetical protein